MSELTKEETIKIKDFKASLEKDFPEEVKDDNCMYRFLKARKWILQDAEAMFRNRMKWLREMKPNEITEKDCLGEIIESKLFIYGKDKHGRPVIVFRAGKHFPTSENQEKVWQYALFLIETSLKNLPPPPYNQFIIIYDRSDFSRANFDLGLMKKIATLGDYYPELLGKVYVLYANWLFSMLYSIVGMFLDPVTKDKIKISDLSELAEAIDDTNRLPEYQGKSFDKSLMFPESCPQKYE